MLKTDVAIEKEMLHRRKKMCNFAFVKVFGKSVRMKRESGEKPGLYP